MPPYERPGRRHYATAIRALSHGAPCVVDEFVGVASKQKQPLSSAGLGGTPNPQINIPIGEQFVIVEAGIVLVPYVATAAKGSTVWINVTNDALTLTDPGAGNGRKFGRVEEIQGQRNTPTGFMRVNLDRKDSF
jgi:hypothetical protein